MIGLTHAVEMSMDRRNKYFTKDRVHASNKSKGMWF